MTAVEKRRCVECKRLVREQSTPAEHQLSCSIGWSANVTHIGTTAAEESLIRAAIAHVKALGLTGGTLTEAVAKVLEERREG